LNGGPVAGAATQLCYQGVPPEDKQLGAAKGNLTTTPPCGAPDRIETPRGPGAKGFGAWLRAEHIARGIDAQTLADALGVDLNGLAMMEADRVEMPMSQRRRAEAALVKAAS
jgi:hypothetical protein